MIVGDLLLVMAGDPYFGPPISRATCSANFLVEVSNRTGTSQLVVTIQHRNRDDTAWGAAGTIGPIAANGTYPAQLSGLKELVRYSYAFTAGAPTDGMYVFGASPQWLND
jgi:hypothetical protein